MKKAFVNDPNRGESKGTMKATVSRHPYDVAGMSTDRQWKSCMGMSPKDRTSTNYSNKLKKDIEHGTHVAYLHPQDDHNIDKPVSRIALKPFHSEHGHSVLRPEQKVYGENHPEFVNKVHDWAKKNFPMHPNHVYHKDENVYDDSGHMFADSQVALHHTDNHELFKNNSPDSLEKAVAGGVVKGDKKINYDHVHHLIPHLGSSHGELLDHIVRHSDNNDTREKLIEDSHRYPHIGRAMAWHAHKLPRALRHIMTDHPDDATRRISRQSLRDHGENYDE